MDPSDVMPLLGEFYPNATEVEMSELADVAIVNCPELTKGEETGFEFVHKSFAEYLVAEQMAHSIERAIFKAPQFGSDEHTWRMTDDEAAAELAPVIGIRLITQEVQEMLEPMLGCLVPFLKGDRVDQVVSGETRKDGLGRIIERFQILFKELLQGRSLDTIDRGTKGRLLINSPLEAYANQCAGYLIIGTAARRQLASIHGNSKTTSPMFSAVPYEGAFWQCLCLLHAGGLTIDRNLAERLTNGLTVQDIGGGKGLDDRSLPIRPALLAGIHGYEASITKSFIKYAEEVALLSFRTNFLMLILYYLKAEVSHGLRFRFELSVPEELSGRAIWMGRGSDSFPDVMRQAGLLEDSMLDTNRPEVQRWREIEHRLARAKNPQMALDMIGEILHEMARRPISRQDEYTVLLISELFPVVVDGSSSKHGFLNKLRDTFDKFHK